MPTDRDILAAYYEKPEAIEFYKRNGWPEWRGDFGWRVRAIYNRRAWNLQSSPTEFGPWEYVRNMDDHTALVHLRDHRREWLRRRWYSIEIHLSAEQCSIAMYGPPDKNGDYAAGNYAIKATEDAALWAALAAEGEK